MKPLNILFFGSAPESNLVFNQLKSTYKSTYPSTCKDSLRRLGKPDLIVVASYGHKIPQKTLDFPKHGSLNIHPSLLPKYRGATPVPSAILANDKITGVSIIKMTNKIDAGPILAQKKVLIKPNDTTPILLKRCFTIGAKLLINILPDYLNNKITLKIQDKSQVTYTKKFTKQDGFISWQEFLKASTTNFTSINHKIRALHPWPGIWTKMPACAGRPTNKTLKLLPKNLFQLEGKSPISWQQFKNGYQFLLK
ncbi:MAG: methionyl-tRNA formyltransferase [Patescibacteria group bacterium]|nr:methionyl-tRNA formyltransferase [Patescibacteria group bacterium]